MIEGKAMKDKIDMRLILLRNKKIHLLMLGEYDQITHCQNGYAVSYLNAG